LEGGILVQRKAIIGFLVAVVVGNLVLLLSQPRTTRARPDPNDKRPAVERLASRAVGSYSELPEAAAAAGLRLGRRFTYSVDNIVRVDAQRVTMDGWLADTDGDGTPLDVLIFVGAAVVGAVATKGEVPGVAKDYRFGLGAEKNIAFQSTFPCRSGEQPVVAGVGPKERYVPMRSPPCP
jgi:hypothetical protein